jgi:hypothetical protein
LLASLVELMDLQKKCREHGGIVSWPVTISRIEFTNSGDFDAGQHR